MADRFARRLSVVVGVDGAEAAAVGRCALIAVVVVVVVVVSHDRLRATVILDVDEALFRIMGDISAREEDRRLNIKMDMGRIVFMLLILPC